MMRFQSVSDLRRHVADANPDFSEHNLDENLVQALLHMKARPKWGADWSAWYGKNIHKAREKVAKSPSARHSR